MKTAGAGPPGERGRLIEEVRVRWAGDIGPRRTMALIVAGSGAAAFLCSYSLLQAGVTTMSVRYFVSASFGYVVFFVSLWAWVEHGRRTSAWSDAADVVMDPLDLLPGQRSLGQVIPEPVEAVGSRAAAGSGDWLPDFGEGWWVVAAIGVLAGLAAAAWVVYMAPVLLAEVALDAALVSAVYRKLRPQDIRSWPGSVLRRTWLPAIALVLFVTAVGLAVERAVPGARSIGDVRGGILSR